MPHIHEVSGSDPDLPHALLSAQVAWSMGAREGSVISAWYSLLVRKPHIATRQVYSMGYNIKIK